MNHKNRGNTFKRQTRKIRPQRKVILYVEGENTEKSYFDLLKKANCKVIPVTKSGHGISQCEKFVMQSYNDWRRLPKEERGKYKQKWLVFDADDRDDFADGIKLAMEKGFGVAFSNMCIEYWFMLHFYDHDGSAIPLIGNSHSAAQIERINTFIKNYNKKNKGTANTPVAEYSSNSKKVEEDFFDLMLAIDPVKKKSRIVLAFERAKTIHETKKVNGAESSESVTTIYMLLQELGVIEKYKDGFVLFKN